MISHPPQAKLPPTSRPPGTHESSPSSFPHSSLTCLYVVHIAPPSPPSKSLLPKCFDHVVVPGNITRIVVFVDPLTAVVAVVVDPVAIVIFFPSKDDPFSHTLTRPLPTYQPIHPLTETATVASAPESPPTAAHAWKY